MRHIPFFNARFIVTVSTLLALIALSGCQGTKMAYEAAEGLNENAKVVAEHYYALVKEANDMKKAGTLAGGDLVSAQNLVRDTKPAVDQLVATAQAYERAATAETEKELEAAISEAAIAISKLIDIINMAKDSASLSLPKAA